jgi:hypothetical protein
MDDNRQLAETLIRSYGLTIFPDDKAALEKSLDEVLAAAKTIKLGRTMTDEPASIFRLRPATSRQK